MADENENIQYSFTGDSTELVAASQQAISALSSYEGALSRVENTLAQYNQVMSLFFQGLSALLRYLQQVNSATTEQATQARSGASSTEIWEAATRQAALALSGFNSSLALVVQGTKQVDDANKKSKTNWTEIYDSIMSAKRALEQIKTPAIDVSGALSGISSSLQSAVSAAKTFLGIDLAGVFKDAVTESMNYIENLNLFTVVMGEAVDSGMEFVNTMQSMYGLDPSSILRYTSSFQELAIAAQMSDKAAASLSTGMMSLATDVSSLYNIDIESAAQRMRSAMLGMQKSASQLGVDIRTTTLQFYAQQLGIQGNVRNMSEANREALRYIAMVEQLSFANGDWAKTIESPSNQLRILKEQLTQLARAIGNLFLNSIAKVLPYINGLVMALREMLTYVGTLLGLDWSGEIQGSTSQVEDLTGSINDTEDAIDSATEAAKKMVAPFDELNVISDTPSSGSNKSSGDQDSMGLDPALEDAISKLGGGLTDVRMKAVEVKDKILDLFRTKDGNLYPILSKIRDIVEHLRTLFDTLKKKISEALKFDNSGDKILGNLLGIVEDLVSWFDNLITITTEWLDGVDFGPLAESLANLSGALRNLFQTGEDSSEGFYQNVILPLAQWVIEDALPDIINAIANGLQWFADHPEVAAIIAGIAAAIAIVVGAITLFNTVMTIASTVIGIVQTVSAPVLLIIAAIIVVIGLLIAAIVMVLTHLDEIKAWVQDKFPAIYNIISSVVKGIKTALAVAWSVIKSKLKDAFQFVKDILYVGFKNAKNVFKDLFSIIEGLLTGNWTKVWKSAVNVVIDLLNILIGALGSALLWIARRVGYWLDKLGSFVSKIGDLMGKSWGWHLDLDKLDISKIQIPRLASGGVVNKPTNAIVGEGKYDEAIIPLGNSPQLNDMLDRFAEKVNRTGADSTVKVYIGDSEWDAFTYKSSLRGKSRVGEPVIGGATRG